MELKYLAETRRNYEKNEENCSIHMAFASSTQRKQYEKQFCQCCWKQCLIADAHNRKWDYEAWKGCEKACVITRTLATAAKKGATEAKDASLGKCDSGRSGSSSTAIRSANIGSRNRKEKRSFPMSIRTWSRNIWMRVPARVANLSCCVMCRAVRITTGGMQEWRLSGKN